MPKAYPKEFRDDPVAVAQRREAGVTIKQIAEDFGISETCLQNWLRRAEIEAGAWLESTAAESAQLRDLRKRNRVLEQENEVLRQAASYLYQANLPGKGSTRSWARWPGTASPSRSRVGCSSLLVSRITGG